MHVNTCWGVCMHGHTRVYFTSTLNLSLLVHSANPPGNLSPMKIDVDVEESSVLVAG